MSLVSECRWLWEGIRREPVWLQRAWFWMRWSLRILEGEVLGNHSGDAEVKSRWIRDLKVFCMVFLCFPHEMPDKD